MAKDSYKTVFGALVFAVVVTFGAITLSSLIIKIFTVFGWGIVLFTIYFFRDPKRITPSDDHLVISAADGKILEIKEISENAYLKSKAWQVSIFLSIFNVHINRVPISGRVGFFEYYPGKFVKAYKQIASRDNEQTMIGIENENQNVKVVVKQIAGAVARRIVCHIREGFSVARGEKFGMIKFGSRVEMFLPIEADIQVQKGTKVKGGETVIAKINIT